MSYVIAECLNEERDLKKLKLFGGIQHMWADAEFYIDVEPFDPIGVKRMDEFSEAESKALEELLQQNKSLQHIKVENDKKLMYLVYLVLKSKIIESVHGITWTLHTRDGYATYVRGTIDDIGADMQIRVYSEKYSFSISFKDMNEITRYEQPIFTYGMLLKVVKTWMKQKC